MRRRREDADDGGVALLDEAFHLLRRTPAAAWACFYAGSLPLVLGALAFWMDMRRSAFADRHVGEASLLLALLYLWMAAGQAVFAQRLRASLTGAPGTVGALAWWRLALVQAGVRPWSLFVLPASLLLMIPFGWVYAYYQGVAVTGDPAAARRQAVLWPYQNHVVIALLALFSLFVFIDIALSLFLLPGLLKSLTGVETPFSRSPTAMLNSTFFMVSWSLTYLALAPLAKAAYVLRSYRIESMTTGEDLLVELRSLPAVAARTTAALLAASLGLGAGAMVAAAPARGPEASGVGLLEAAAPAALPTATGVPAGALEHAMRRVIERREFRWRLPREEPDPIEREQGVISRFVNAALDTLHGWLGAVYDAIERFGRWLGRRMFSRDRTPADLAGATGWLTSVQWLLGLLLVFVACGAAILLWRGRRSAGVALESREVPHADRTPEPGAEAAGAPPDLWLQRARELVEAGNLRGAMRAIYLAILAHLADRGLVRLELCKSNRDYLREVRRRGRERPDVPVVFSESVQAFERVWYGCHPATGDLVRACRDRFERLRADAGE